MNKAHLMTPLLFAVLAGCGAGTGSDGASTVQSLPKLLATSGVGSPNYRTIVQQLYISYFGRPADTGGLASFETQLAALGGPTDIQQLDQAYRTNVGIRLLVDSFGRSAESTALYSGDNTTFISAIYQNVLNRTPDAGGLAFWVGALNNGSLTRANASLSIMAGALANTSAQGQMDASLVNRKVTVGSNFTTALASASVNGYSGNAAAAKARALLTSVSSTTVATAFQATVDALVSDLATILVSPGINAAPIASAGAPQTVSPNKLVTLDGSASSDANTDPLTYAWTLTTKPVGSTATFSQLTSVHPTFVADLPGNYVASLIVNDGKVNSTASTITVTAANSPPVANAGAASRAVIGSTATFNGAGSADANGDAITYSWTLTSKPPGSQATLSATDTVNPSIIADMAGTYVASLIVNDGKLQSSTVTTTLTAVPRVAAAMGISFVDNYGDFCNMSGSFVTMGTSGSGNWTVANCHVYGTAGSALRARIQNNGVTAIKLNSIAIFAVYFGNGYSISPASQTILPGQTSDFLLPLWMSLDITDATATFKIDGEPDLVVRLKGNMILP